GIVLRTIAIPIFENVQFTLGMIAPILSGMITGLYGGLITGSIVGIYAAVFSGEFWAIPLIGNICLGISTGIISQMLPKENYDKIKIPLYICASAIIGGFIPTFAFLLLLIPSPVFAATGAVIDMINAAIAAVVSIPIWYKVKSITSK
ncbi:MAG: LytS/YhcK type 5TM receptor domain-containing protein, partial [Candidatus Odinarchaeia archaeon]